MNTHYRLSPPFLYVAEEQNFSDTWEAFCCKLLKISNKTTDIYIRNPPEQGVDIYYPSKKIAYQCKSIESGKSGDFNVTQAIKSIEAAKRIQADLGWEKYILCVNVAISGSAEATLRKELPDIEILPNSYWVGLCEANPIEVERNFRRLLDVPRQKVLDAIQNRFVDHYSAQLKQKIEDASFDIFLFSNRYDTVYRVPVAESFNCSDLLNVFREFFKLPESTSISTEGIDVSLTHAMVFNGKIIPLKNSLGNSGVSHGSVITYWTTICWKDAEAEFKSDVMNMMTLDMIMGSSRHIDQRKERAIAAFSEAIKLCFQYFDDSISRKSQ